MANDIEIVVRGKNEAGKLFADLNRSIGQTKRGAAAAWKELDVLAVAAELAAAEMRKLQDALDGINASSAKQVTEAVGDLTREAITASTAVDVLAGSGATLAAGAVAAEEAAEAVDEIGDQARQAKDDVDGLGDELDGLGKSGVSGLLGALGNIPNLFKGKSLGGVVSGIAGSVTTGISDGMAEAPGIIGKFFAATGPVGVVIAAGLAAALGTAAMTALAGAGIGAAAAAGIAAGVAGAANDQRVAAAAIDLGNAFTSQLSNIGVPFIKPVLSAIKELKGGLLNLGLAEAFAPLAPIVPRIASGLVSMVREAMPGIKSLVAAAEPFISQMVADMPRVGEAVGNFAKSLGEAGPGAAKLFHTFITYSSLALESFGMFVEGSGKLLNIIGTTLEKLGVFKFDDNNSWKMAQFGETGSKAFSDVAAGATSANDALLTLQESFDRINGKAISAMEAESAYQAAIDAATESIATHGATLDLNTDAGRKNQDALIAIAETSAAAAQAIYNETYATQGETAAQEAAAAAWNRGRDQLVALAQNMGMSTEKAQALANKILGIPDFKHVAVSVDTSAAEAALARVRSQIASLSRVNTAELQNYYGSIPAPKERGGPVKAGEAYIVGEKRPELFVPSESGFILPEVPTFPSRPGGNAAVASGGGYSSTAQNIINVYVSALDPRAAATAVGEALTEWVRTSGPIPARMVAPA
jgi:hypothetical protein